MAEARARAAHHAEAELAEFRHEHLDDLRGHLDLKLPQKGLYSTLIPELSQPAFE
jgi:hypothetical protein